MIRIHDWAWRVIAQSDPDSAPEDDIHSLIKLQELDFDEMSAIELFAIDSLDLQNGLSSLEHPEHWDTEKEEEQTR